MSGMNKLNMFISEIINKVVKLITPGTLIYQIKKKINIGGHSSLMSFLLVGPTT